MRLGPNWYQIGNKTSYISNVRNFSAEKRYLWHVSKCFADQNIVEMGNPNELNFEGLQIKNLNLATDRTQKVDEKRESFVSLSCL